MTLAFAFAFAPRWVPTRVVTHRMARNESGLGCRMRMRGNSTARPDVESVAPCTPSTTSYILGAICRAKKMTYMQVLTTRAQGIRSAEGGCTSCSQIDLARTSASAVGVDIKKGARTRRRLTTRGRTGGRLCARGSPPHCCDSRATSTEYA
ncbi:hypothetical protein B0H11DRAFT_1912601 [Mycena galericulata]|nr:hypothetical protein B0H11DRAFT_1912601 [Mycena galericulata]